MTESRLPLAQLLQAARDGALVLTVNQRLERYLRRLFDDECRAAGEQAWAAPAIRSLGRWQKELCDQLGLAHACLTPAQALRLWEEIIEQDLTQCGAGLLRVGETAKLAGEAHALLCEYGVSFNAAEGGEDHQVFLRWQGAFEAALERGGWQDPARLPERLAAALAGGEAICPKRVWLAGFDDLRPAVLRLTAALAAGGAAVGSWRGAPGAPSRAGQVTGLDPEDEVRRCARWARNLLTQSDATIGIIAVDLAAYQKTLQRIFREELAPSSLLPGAAQEKAFNLSLGTPLAATGMVVAALELLSLGRQVSLDRISYLLRSPFVWGYLAESSARALFDRELRQLRQTAWPLPQLVKRARSGFKKGLGRCDIFARMLENVHSALEDRSRRRPGAWAESFARLLDDCHWPGDRRLDSRDYQLFVAWKEVLAGLAAYDEVCSPMGRAEALTLLKRAAGETLFQPQGSEERLQILGTLEAAGLQFDHVWILGLHEQALPAPARPNPFLPLDLQRRHGMPHADAARELDFAGRVLDRLLTAAPQVVVSWPARQDGQPCRISPLVRHLPEWNPELADSQAPARIVRRESGPLEAWVDDLGAPLPAGVRVSGGTAILKDQALCPFRAYARHRLAADGLAVGSLGLDGLDRGVLVHDALEHFWRQTGDWHQLQALSELARRSRLATCVNRALQRLEKDRQLHLPAALRAIEARRLTELLAEWLLVEGARAPFVVEELERWHQESLAQLTIQTRIDRIDRLADGSRLIIDYKTGRPALGDLLGRRPVEPQLPLYGVGRQQEELAAVAFGRVRRGDCGFVGLACRDEILPRVAAVTDGGLPVPAGGSAWQSLLEFWREALLDLARAFAAGRAEVDPISARQACDRCDLQALCRIGGTADFEAAEETP